ncbi:Gfo/Idh/MocA family protein [Rothia halotolerans]|uniref:Gfo/Idh/MocA family protein n=1 Tax=Rothia halotolerans TaxID=405770 RepID=UPI00101BC668|nr:Gfo/Idh/MocA family oxidoreductase [Rothia halotolerans]
MLRLGIIGTGAISSAFARAAAASGAYRLAGVASRSEDSGRRFLAALEEVRGLGASEARVHRSAAELCEEGAEVLYLASPNSLHARDALEAIERGADVIVEKPAFLDPAQWEAVHDAARRRGALVLEAARNLYEPGFAAVAEAVAARAARGERPVAATLSYAQYSSRWDRVLEGEEPNIFSPAFGGGALVDLGVYALYAALAWLGTPEDAVYVPHLAPTGVDAHGTAVLTYPWGTVTVLTGKDHAEPSGARIHYAHGEVSCDGVQAITRAEDTARGKLFAALAPAEEGLAGWMAFEARSFARLLEARRDAGLDAAQRAEYERVTELSHEVNRLATRLRHGAGIRFADEGPEDSGATPG